MNRQELNNCFEAMSPSDEQKERLFKDIMAKKTAPVKIYYFNRYAAGIAAVFVVGVFAIAYPNIKNNDILEHMSGQYAVVDYGQDNENIITKESRASNFEYKEEQQNRDNTDYGMLKKDTNTDSAVAEQDSLSEMAKQEYQQENGTQTDVAYLDSANIQGSECNKEATAEENTNNGSSAVASSGNINSGVYSIKDRIDLTLEQIEENEVYTKYFPTKFPDGFEFVSAFTDEENILHTTFDNADGNYITVLAGEKEKLDVRHQVIEPEKIIEIQTEGYIDFAVDCGEYYVVYKGQPGDLYELYKTVISSKYFDN